MKPDLSRIRILVAGDIMLDRYWFGDVNRISPEAPVPVVRIEREEARLGGAANVARNTAALGCPSSLLGITGSDEAGNTLENLLHEAGITPYLHQDSSISTIIKLRVIGRQQQLLRVDFEKKPGKEAVNRKTGHFRTLLPKHDIILLSDYAKGALEQVAGMIRLARAAGKPVLVDPKGDDFTRYTGATVLTPNKSELRQIVGSWESEAQLAEKAQRLRAELKLDYLLLTRSEEGMSLYGENQTIHIPAIAREVYDVSGAGDTVIATLAAMMGAGMDMAEAVATANRAAGIVVGKLGTATVTATELFA
ncbi:MAG: D-glycero-beta-D-manno-heptose-7-phosphate kinase [Alistipes senegalensis]|nr:D-glycero-beta-D-manno-heptose-7-phosphate kinase [Oxalobacter formigenes]MCM1280606.1 D-glycero-beta-D-manno-heptose-7-phosphate kinase [Alistipes senegalensis]